MLKFKLTRDNNSLDKKVLTVTNTEVFDVPIIDIPDGDYGTVNEITDKYTYSFSVKDLYNIDYGTKIQSFNRIVVGNDEDGTSQEYTYEQDYIVQSADKVDNSFTIHVDKEFQLNVKSISIETRYNAIYYYNDKWITQRVPLEWFDEECSSFDEVIFLSTEKVAYGKNVRQIESSHKYSSGEMVNEYTVFYYENDSWKNVDLEGDDLEGCLTNGKICFNSFHKYDTTKRDAEFLEENKLYYTRENYIVLQVSPTHYFTTPNENIDYTYPDSEDVEQVPYLTRTDYWREIINSVNYPFIYLYFRNGSAANAVKVKKEIYIEDNSTLIFNYDNFTKYLTDTVDENSEATYPIVISKQEDSVTITDNGTISIDEKTIYRRLTEDEIKAIDDYIFPYGYDMEIVNHFGNYIDGRIDITDDFYNVYTQNGSVGNIKFKRDNFLFGEDVSYSLTYNSAINVVQIPISQKFETDLYHNDALKTNYVDKAKENAINPIIDMEKNIYTPAISKSKDRITEEEQINSDYIDCYKIIFNLHFRKHRDKYSASGTKTEWTCNRDDLWNGTYNDTETGKVLLKPNVENENETAFFSYYSDDDEKCYQSYQSDLLSFLGFSNDDIKYQKSKLKKSFLRISFYDSENIGNQNLLCTSTIFLDSGDLFAKYIKHIETFDKEYKNDENIEGTKMAVIGSSLTDTETNVSYGNNGVRINREPQWTSETKPKDFSDNVDEWESLRLSSQFMVTDKFSSKKSSEGFYFYTYKSNDNGVYPTDIYMRVEFNHAGYGRTIPFMMPYVRENEIENGTYTERKIKSFQDICTDWSKPQDGTEEEVDYGYNGVRYIKYSHIKWKYRYDKDTQKYIYYLDPELYGRSVISETNGHGNNIILNLYEGAVR